MQTTFEKRAGIFLLIFVILLVFTMIMHPAGGSIEYLISITPLLVTTHAIAIFSIPFGWTGFWGFTSRLGKENALSMLGFAFISLALVAVMMAAATNGLILPLYLQHYRNVTQEVTESIKIVTKYSGAVNLAFDYMYTVAFCAGIFCWSVIILKSKKMPVWLGWFGIVIGVIIITALISGMAVNQLHSFRILVSTQVLWIVLAGVQLTRS